MTFIPIFSLILAAGYVALFEFTTYYVLKRWHIAVNKSAWVFLYWPVLLLCSVFCWTGISQDRSIGNWAPFDIIAVAHVIVCNCAYFVTRNPNNSSSTSSATRQGNTSTSGTTSPSSQSQHHRKD